MLTRAVVAGVMRALVKAWEPDWALATSEDLWRQLSLGAETDTFVGWMTWVPRAHGAVRQLPDPARVEEVEDKGSLIVLTPEQLRSDNPEHLALARRVQRSLKARGLLRPLMDVGAEPRDKEEPGPVGTVEPGQNLAQCGEWLPFNNTAPQEKLFINTSGSAS